MTGAMKELFYYVAEKRLSRYLPEDYDHFCSSYLDTLEAALAATFTPQQKELWRQWQDEQFKYNDLCERAIFQAAFDLCRELG